MIEIAWFLHTTIKVPFPLQIVWYVIGWWDDVPWNDETNIGSEINNEIGNKQHI